MGRRKVTVTYPGNTIDPLDQMAQVNGYGHSVKLTAPLTAELMREAVAKLKAYNALDMVGSFYGTALLDRLEGWTVLDKNDRPDWIQKLEKEWGIR